MIVTTSMISSNVKADRLFLELIVIPTQTANEILRFNLMRRLQDVIRFVPEILELDLSGTDRNRRS